MNRCFGLCLLMVVPPACAQEPAPGNRGAEFWMEKLKSGTAVERVEATRILSRHGGSSPKVILALIGAQRIRSSIHRSRLDLILPKL